MVGKIIDGKQIASRITDAIKSQVEDLISSRNISLKLAVIMVGHNPASELYVSRKVMVAKNIGIDTEIFRLNDDVDVVDLEKKISELNVDKAVHGILVQLPLPKHINIHRVIDTIDPLKDVDGFTYTNIGKLITMQDGLFPCTPQGCLELIKSVNPNISGKNAVVIGRSNIVGRPMSNILMNEDCTVTVVHLETKNPKEVARSADILVVATGVPHLVKEDWVKDGAIVIDVGISKVVQDGKEKIVGDVDFNNVLKKAGAITPVPGGVGPMTIAYLMKNVVKAYRMQNNL
ncbi:MAG: bifunctional 5,10-methylenetetrahydrofolate dehydrogenase/5,10-methenyltetrahydrofolate cyclohydrolase [Rickettsiales bacterium]|nr:bifunctional 5,10-methylenetetrahydrofolate dehydrogenase/5,10-methenyltetrahydrofolate cyclohydrolase [Rickettsiales bacterium]